MTKVNDTSITGSRGVSDTEKVQDSWNHGRWIEFLLASRNDPPNYVSAVEVKANDFWKRCTDKRSRSVRDLIQRCTILNLERDL